MISLFKDRSAVSVFWLIIICFGLHTNSLLNPPDVVISPADGYFYYILRPLQQAQPYLASLLFILLIFLLALQLNFVLNALRMYSRQGNAAALAFLLFSALLPQFNVLSTALFACNLFIWILYSACSLYAASRPKAAIYNFGMFCGLSILLYYPSFPLVIIAFLTLMIIRSFKINEWFVLLFGLLTPAYFLISYLFLTGNLKFLPQPRQIFDMIQMPVPPIMFIITFSVSTLIILWGIFSVQSSGVNTLIQVRKSWSVFFAAMLLMLPVVFFIKGAYPLVLLLVVLPGAAYTGYAFAHSRNILPVIFFWALVGLSIYNNWFAKY
ncbi:hypothetical protein [Parafilimonas sp.]|uniref:hypothetical protein n=1 Tax=Parafilimonas sp. TaxID=1969739 RepID=UPI0039E47E8E